MKNNPFAAKSISAPVAEKTQNFITSSWQQHAELVNHLCQFSQNVLLVLAPQGGGKTTFVQHCQQMAIAGVRKLVVKAQPNEIIEDTLKKIIQGFGLTWQGLKNTNDQIRTVIEEANRQHASWVLFIDDAHLLSNDQVKSLLQLVKFNDDPRKQLHLVLIGEPSLELRLFSAEFTPYVHGKIYTIELESWTLQEVKSFLTKDGLLPGVSPAELAAIFERSRGLPGYVVREKNVVNEPLEMELTTKKSAKKWGRHPVTYGLCLGVLVGGTYLIVNNQPSEKEASTVALAIAPPPAKNVDFQFAKDKAASVPAPAPTVAAASPTSKPASPVTLASNVPTLDLDQPPEKADGPDDNEEMAEPELAQKEVNEMQEVSESASISVPELSKKAIPDDSPRVAAALNKKTSKAKTKKSLAQPKAPVIASRTQGYTLQLLGGRSERSIKQFVQQHNLQSKAHCLHTKRGGEDWYIVVYGEYPSQDAAKAAIKSIPSSIKKAGLQPWVRPMQAVQADVRSQNG